MRANEQAPVIIKRVKKVSGGGHHGGAWKVAYADFVTAMMAFFLLMWLLNATTESQRKGIADYFSPTVPMVRVSGGGDGAFGGDSIFSEETHLRTGSGGVPKPPSTSEGSGTTHTEGGPANHAALVESIENMLSARGGESMASKGLARHIVTRVTDEGLLIELLDLEDDPLFLAGTAQPAPILDELLTVIANVFVTVENGIAIEGHVATPPVVIAEDQSWRLSGARASQTRELLEAKGLPEARIMRVTGHANREPRQDNVMAPENNRIEVILLRSDQP